MPDKDAHIGEQNSIYRRGMVLGLTMAEIMILILFTLLLAIAAAIATKEQRISELEVLRTRFIETLAPDSGGVRVSDVVQHIERQSREIVQLEQALAQAGGRVAELEQEMEDIIREIDRDSGGEEALSSAVERIERQNSDIARLEQELAQAKADAGQLEQEMEDIIREIERQSGGELDPAEVREHVKEYIKEAYDLANADETPGDEAREGQGNEFPSCWLTEARRIESIFDVTFTSEGIRLAHRDLPHRDAELEALPLSSLETDTSLSLAEFRSQLEPLYLWSVAKECRFYVVRYSIGALDANQVNAVDGYFYPGSSIRVVSGR